MVVDGDSFLPGVIGSGNVEAERTQTNSHPTESRAELDGDRLPFWVLSVAHSWVTLKGAVPTPRPATMNCLKLLVSLG